ncbi:hypothetical protein [Allocoleopsis sp.]|uniref:hypothetical protein n=1 Tax=Allocoleopsis sp. TaxID=3088169 RepID=UPI002FD26D33
MNQLQTSFVVIASAAILVVPAVTGELINAPADASQIQPPTSQRVSQSRRTINEKKAINAVWQLRQVQQKVQTIKRLSKGKAHVGLRVDSSPTTAEPYYVIQLFEEHSDRITTLDWFHVSTQGAVTVLDAVTGKYISPPK